MMEKRRRADGQIRDEIDRISMLPDGILDCILSRLSLKEAVGTSILSSRWRYLWTFLSKLDFDGTLFESWKKVRKLKIRAREANWKSKCIGMVDDVLALHNKESIEEFRIHFDLDKSDSRWIDKCVRFALANKVEKLELDLFYPAGNAALLGNAANYVFPLDDLLGAGSDLADNFKFLRTLSTKYVDVSGEALELLLCNSPLLEHLSVSDSQHLLNLRVIRPFPSLKRLEISMGPSGCNLKSVEIRDANLVFLKYEGETVPFVLENVPLLLNLHYGKIALDDINDVVPMFASILPQLETFTVDFEFYEGFSVMETPIFREKVKMNKLKQLVVTYDPWDDEPLFHILPFVNLTAASPCLERFVIQLYRRWYFDPMRDEEREIKTIERSYSRLREVELVGYCGITSDLELVMHFVHNAAALEKIVVNTCYPHYAHLARVAYDSTRSITEVEEAETRCEEMDAIIQQLTDIVPPKIQLKILGSAKVVMIFP